MTTFLALLRRIPIWCYPMIALAIWGAIGHHRYNALRAEFAEYRAQYNEQATKAIEQKLVESQRRVEAQSHAGAEYAKQLDQATSDAAAAGDAAGRLRAQLARIRAAGCGHPTAAAGGASGTDPVRVLTDVLTSCTDAYRGMAAVAGTARARGGLCEADYDALKR